MAKGGEIRLLDEQGRAFPDLLAFTNSGQFTRTNIDLGLSPPQSYEHISDADPLAARIYRDLWIVDCPNCSGAEAVWLRGPLLMWCHSCGNGYLGGSWRRVELAPNRAVVEALLDQRPDPASRNYDPARETLADLQAEQIANGDPVESISHEIPRDL